MTGVLLRRPGKDTERQTHAKGRWPYEDRGRNWSDVSISQRMSGITGKRQKLGRGEEGFFPGAVRGSTPN